MFLQIPKRSSEMIIFEPKNRKSPEMKFLNQKVEVSGHKIESSQT
jgi:hypothetical protein